jgi:hypothetical protein
VAGVDPSPGTPTARSRPHRPCEARRGFKADHRLNEDGAVHTHATTTYLTLEIRVVNTGDKVAGRAQVSVWVPRSLSAMTIRWVNDAWDPMLGKARPVPSPARLRDDHGGEVESWHLLRTIPRVPTLGARLYLRLPCTVEPGGRSSVPIRVLVRAEDAERDAEADYMLRLVHVQA